MDILLYILGIVAVIFGIALSIGLHELGHYLPAKKFGVRVKQFMVGFGPTVRSWTRGETEFGVKAIPLGGYILMTGMYPPEKKPYRGLFSKWINEARQFEREDIQESDAGRQFYALAPYKKLIIMLGGPFMNFLLGMLLIAIALSGIGTLQQGLSIQKVYECVDVAQDGTCPSGSPKSPAALAGLQPGDTVSEVNGKPVVSWTEVIAAFNENLGQSSQLVVIRDSEAKSITVTPVFIERPLYDSDGKVLMNADGEPQTEFKPLLGIMLEPQNVQMSLVDSVNYGLGATGATFGFILTLPQQVWAVTSSTFGFSERDPNGAVSIVGVGQLAGELSQSELPLSSKIASLLMLLGALNLALFAFNLIPLLPLDGGHVLGAIYESLKRRFGRVFLKKDPGPIDTARTLPLAYGVWLVLSVVGLLLILADIVNPITLG
jgi:membrane-associated protease RseP (regulator of RpoE activity)